MSTVTDPTDPANMDEGDFDKITEVPYGTPIDYEDMTDNQVYRFTLNAAGLAALNTAVQSGEYFPVGLRNANYDAANEAPPWSSVKGSGISLRASPTEPHWFGRLVVTAILVGGYWAESTEWHYIEQTGGERYFEGTATGTTGKDPGNFFVEGTYFHYIDETGAERRIQGAAEGAEGAEAGHFWVEVTAWRYIDAGGDERYIEGTLEP